jgi:hypothetical protein
MSGARVRVLRPDDLCVCELELVGVDVAGSLPNRQLTPAAGSGDRLIVMHLPPQHVAEGAFDEREPPRERILVGSRVAGPSRIAFRVDPTALPVNYTLPAILELLAGSRLAVSENAGRPPPPPGCLNLFALLVALFNPPPGPSAPGPAETAIELPFRLILSPEPESGFSHLSGPVAGTGSTRVELWHSQLVPAPDRDGQREVRAIWMRQGDGPAWDPQRPKWPAAPAPTGDDEPFDPNMMSQRNAMSQRDRADIVHLSANRRYAFETRTDYEPKPVAVRRLALSSLGAWLDSRGDWDPPPAVTSLIEWTHRATQGRDQFVRIVNLGYLYPFGHLAAKITVTERKFTLGPGRPPLLLQRDFIVVRKPLKTFEPAAAPARQWHTMPLRTVRLRTLVTPPLKVPTHAEGGDSCFLIVASDDSDPFMFKLTGTDAQTNRIDLVTPLVWIVSTEGGNPVTIGKAQSLYDAAAASHALNAHGAPLALGDSPDGDATYPAAKLVFTAPPPTAPAPGAVGDQPAFWPKLTTAEVRAPALDIVAGLNKWATVAYHEAYELHGFGGDNRNELIASLANKLDFDVGGKGDRSGGLLKPSMDVQGLSRLLGPVGGPAAKLAEVAAGKFDPASFFGDRGKLFGVFKLDQVLAIVTGTQPSDVPRIVTEGVPDSLVARQVWKPVLQSYPPEKSIFVVGNGTAMEIDATIDARSGTPRADVRSTLTNFRIHLLGDPTFLDLAFDKVEFVAKAGRKLDVDVVLREVRFVGPLSFVERIRTLIPLDGFSDPPAIAVDPSGVRSSFSLALPNLAVGVFSLQNVSLGAGFAIPFVDGALTVSFNFCARQEPFLLTVSLFGGGGFFALSLDPNGVQVLEAALEFGASVAINLGVAQGGVHVMGGIYFKIESGKGCTLSGYFRLGGNMSVLGLISASIELNLSLTYQDPGKAIGRAVVTVEIDIFLFSMSVEVECERRFAGSASDPSFEELMGPYDADGAIVRPWHDYCDAYA